MKNRTRKTSRREAKLAVVEGGNASGALRACFGGQQEGLQPLLELAANARASVDELMSEAARGLIEQLLVLSAQEVAGAKHPGRRGCEIGWHGSQPGRIVLAERKLAVRRPRLRRRAGQEVAIPVYARLQAEPRLAQRMHDIVVRGVSTRKYAHVLPQMAGSVGMAKSSVSRQSIHASSTALQRLMSRRFDDVDILALWVDGIVVDTQHIVAAIGVDA